MTLDVVAQARSVRLRLSGELWLFVAPRHRLEQVEIHHDGTATLGHLVEALGVPLTEVGALLAGSVAVSQRADPRSRGRDGSRHRELSNRTPT